MIDLNKNQKIIVCIIFFIILIVIGYYIYKITQENNESILNIDSESMIEKTNDKIENEEFIIVHVAGAVENEGIQKLPTGSRIADAVDAAGGLTSDANSKSINLAQKIIDGQKIYIPTITEDVNQEEISEITIVQESEIDNTTFSQEELININTATQTELETLPGIGPSTALKIIDYRKENGKFNSIEDIQNVSGIGNSKYIQIRDKITV